VLQPKLYRDAPVRLLLSDALAGGGERLSATIDPAIGSPSRHQWARVQGTVAVSVQDIIGPALGWRVLPDGSVWVGVETWPAAPEFEYTVTDRMPERGAIEIGTSAGLPLPGTVFESGRVSFVEHRIDPSRLRSLVGFES
jgi:hypothetical protein